MYSRAISSNQSIHSALLAAGVVLLLVVFSLLHICGSASAYAATSNMEHQWSEIEQHHEKHDCHLDNTTQDALAKLKNAKLELKPDFTLYQTFSFISSQNDQSNYIQTATHHPLSSAPLFLLTQRLRI